MQLTTTVTLEERTIEPRTCSVVTECVIEPGLGEDYKLLAPYHYRSGAHPPGVHQIYRARHQPTNRTVGVVVYGAPSLNLAIRNEVFGDRYKGSGGAVVQTLRAERLNQEVELIIRVIVHPAFRGTGLGHRLLSQTMPLRPYRYLEASSMMGAINPFNTKAGLTPCRVAHNKPTARVLAALRSVGMRDEDIGNARAILRKLESLPEARREWLQREMFEYETRYVRGRSNRKLVITPESAAKRIASNALMTPLYFIWENPHWQRSGRSAAVGQTTFPGRAAT